MMNDEVYVVRYFEPGRGACLGIRLGDNIHDISQRFDTVSAWLQYTAATDEDPRTALINAASASSLSVFAFASAPDPDKPYFLPPIDDQPVWAAGVTYERSRDARQAEAADGGDVYARVYGAVRPELFFKATGDQVVGPGMEVGIRIDSKWNVPEPELALVINPAMKVVGITVGNDMSSRDIEGSNPLYLPQAKIYTASCGLGPWIRVGNYNSWPETEIQLTIERESEISFQGKIHTRSIHRPLKELIYYLGHSLHFAKGVVLLTGTGIVPPDNFTLVSGDRVQITIDGIGTLSNTVNVISTGVLE